MSPKTEEQIQLTKNKIHLDLLIAFNLDQFMEISGAKFIFHLTACARNVTKDLNWAKYRYKYFD